MATENGHLYILEPLQSLEEQKHEMKRKKESSSSLFGVNFFNLFEKSTDSKMRYKIF